MAASGAHGKSGGSYRNSSMAAWRNRQRRAAAAKMKSSANGSGNGSQRIEKSTWRQHRSDSGIEK
jgi:hypothetical protein